MSETTCLRCSTRWTGMRVEHCMNCHETFTGTSSGDRHRVGDHAVFTGPTRRRCLTPDEMRAKGMVQNARGHWTNGGTSPWGRGEVGTGAGRGGDPASTEATLWVNGSEDCPEAPAQAHLPDDDRCLRCDAPLADDQRSACGSHCRSCPPCRICHDEAAYYERRWL